MIGAPGSVVVFGAGCLDRCCGPGFAGLTGDVWDVMEAWVVLVVVLAGCARLTGDIREGILSRDTGPEGTDSGGGAVTTGAGGALTTGAG